MNPKPPSFAWARAFAVQARADLRARDALLLEEDVPICQQLHFLQMACEKVSKAYRIQGGEAPDAVQASHVTAAKTIPVIAKQLLGRNLIPVQGADKVLHAIGRLAREVELLSPAVRDGGNRPDNCEYPWADDRGGLHIPADFPFSELSRIDSHVAGKTFLKTIAVAAEELAGSDSD